MAQSRAVLLTMMGLITGLAFGFIGCQGNNQKQAGPVVRVFVAKHTLPLDTVMPSGEQLSSLVNEEFVPVEAVPEGAVTNRWELEGSRVRNLIMQGQVVRRHQLRWRGIPPLQPGEVCFCILPDSSWQGIQQLRPGNMVTVLYALPDKTGQPQFHKFRDQCMIAHIQSKVDEEETFDGVPLAAGCVTLVMPYDELLRLNDLQKQGANFILIRLDGLKK
jgi:hypothetical protein